MNDTDFFSSTKLNLDQVFRILDLLKDDTLSKEDLYSKIGGSRQTKIRVVKEMIDHGLICVSSVEAHNKQYLKNTDYGMAFLAMSGGSQSVDMKRDSGYTIVAPDNLRMKGDNKGLLRIKKDLASVNKLLEEESPNIPLIQHVLSGITETLDLMISASEKLNVPAPADHEAGRPAPQHTGTDDPDENKYNIVE
ncbi:MAG: hypothetical protein IKQ60_04330 [Candidatus Methanomethylophilaceae archaeon]|nr:hypothetical protein [Candidatus Methanomethylophilaceae archaeon]